jgi:hypothetical protein
LEKIVLKATFVIALLCKFIAQAVTGAMTALATNGEAAIPIIVPIFLLFHSLIN